jgi:hypothetical protein
MAMVGKLDTIQQPLVLLIAYNRPTGTLFTCTVAALVISIKGIDAALAGFALSFSLDFSGAVMCMKPYLLYFS